jgi:hypothetical protein
MDSAFVYFETEQYNEYTEFIENRIFLQLISLSAYNYFQSEKIMPGWKLSNSDRSQTI